MDRLFKKSGHTDERGAKWDIYEPTIQRKGAETLPDSFQRKTRTQKFGGLDNAFAVKRKGR